MSLSPIRRGAEKSAVERSYQPSERSYQPRRADPFDVTRSYQPRARNFQPWDGATRCLPAASSGRWHARTKVGPPQFPPLASYRDID